MPTPDRANSVEITAVVLAGGRGSRMGGVDKGLQLFRGKPLVAHAMERLAAQTRFAPVAVLINANRNADAYTAMAATVGLMNFSIATCSSAGGKTGAGE